MKPVDPKDLQLADLRVWRAFRNGAIIMSLIDVGIIVWLCLE